MLAGEPLSVSAFLFLMVVTAVAVPGLFLALALLADASFGGIQLLGLIEFCMALR